MAPYDIFPAVDSNYKFPPKVIDGIVNSAEFRALRWAKPLDNSVTDLDQVVEAGAYSITKSLLNRPVDLTGVLTVKSAGDFTFQEYMVYHQSEVSIYVRGRIGVTQWSSWTPIGSGDSGGGTSGESWSKVADPTIKDLDLFIEEGLYSVTGAGIANRPVAAAGALTVLFVNNVVVQEWTTLGPRPRTFIRSRASNGTWSTWMTTNWATPPSITSGKSLNDYTTPGTYIATSGSALNKPTSGLGFLEVVQLTTTSFLQKWTPFDGVTAVFIRSYTSSKGWTSWDSTIWWNGHLPKNTDLNNLSAPGMHSITFVDHPNLPTDRVGTLTIKQGGALITQTYEPAKGTPDTYRRVLTLGIWSSWEKLYSSDNASTSSVSTISLWNAERTSKNQSEIVAAYTQNGSVGFNSNNASGQLRYTRDDGKTWSDLYKFSEPLSFVQQLPDGQLLAVIGNTDGVRSLWRSEGYSDSNPGASKWTKVLTASAPHIYYTSAWSFSVHENIIIVAEYGPKTPTWNDINITSPARYVSMSKDHGKTWVRIFDLIDYLLSDRKLSTTDGQHLHGVLYDPVWKRIWVTFGDNTNGLVYSDDEGTSWKTADWGPTPGAPWQAVGMVSLPGSILFGSDGTPNGVWRLDRRQGKDAGSYKIEAAYTIPDEQGRLSHLCQAIRKVPSINGDVYLFGFGTETIEGTSFIVGTRDGYSFTRIWEDPNTLPLGRGVRSIAGPSSSGLLVVGSNDKYSSGLWSEWRGRYSGDPRVTWQSIENKPTIYTASEVDSKIQSNRWERDQILTTSDRLENLPAGTYRVASSSVATAMGLPVTNSGQLVVYKPHGTVGRAFWYPTSTSQSWQCRQHGAEWLPWEMMASFYDSGPRTLKKYIPDLISGDVTIEKLGYHVTLSLNAAKFSTTERTSGTILTPGLPIGWRPDRIFSIPVQGLTYRMQVTQWGNIQLYNWSNLETYGTITYPCRATPSDLVGDPL